MIFSIFQRTEGLKQTFGLKQTEGLLDMPLETGAYFLMGMEFISSILQLFMSILHLQGKDIGCMVMDSKNQGTNDYELTANYLPETAVLEDEVERAMNPDEEDILWFSLKKGDMHFKIGLSDILMCLKFAEEQGEVPKLPRMWWTRAASVYPKLHSFQPDEKKERNDAQI